MIDPAELRTVQFFASCSAQELRDMARRFTKVSYRKFHEIHAAGAPSEKVFAVLRGDVALHASMGPDKEPQRLAVVTRGEMFGFGEFMLRNYYTAASAMTDCTLLEISGDDFRQHAMAIASVRDHVLTALSQIARYLMSKVAGGSGMNDLALYLLTLSQQCGKTVGDFVHIQNKVHQPEIASLLNLSREHVTRLFARLKQEGAVQFNRGFPIIRKSWLDQAVQDKDLAASIQYRDAPF